MPDAWTSEAISQREPDLLVVLHGHASQCTPVLPFQMEAREDSSETGSYWEKSKMQMNDGFSESFLEDLYAGKPEPPSRKPSGCSHTRVL